jgi:hypothetical protein
MLGLTRRIAKLEVRRPAQGPAQMVDVNQLDPTVLALWRSVGVDQMALAQLALLEADLRRFTV